MFAQIEENTRVLETLGHRFGTPGLYPGSTTADEDDRATPSGRGKQTGKTQERWKTGAKKALLQWCQNQVKFSCCFSFQKKCEHNFKLIRSTLIFSSFLSNMIIY
jgi:hypothetical protein